MNAAKKLKVSSLPQDFSPVSLPEIIKLASVVTGDGVVVYERHDQPFYMETDRLVIRRFTPDDAEAVLALSLDRSTSSMKDFDEQWPTELEGCQAAADYFAGEDTCFAACLKPDMQLIGFISYNHITDNGVLDLGHVWHTAYQDDDLGAEALALMSQYAFETKDIQGVCARNPLDCAEQIAPLKSLGMEILETGEASFVNDAQGNPIKFTWCWMKVTRGQWAARV